MRLRNYTLAAGGAWKSPLGASYPVLIGGLKVTSVRDLTSGYGYDSAAPAPTYQPDLPLSGGHMITFRAGSTNDDGAAITLTIRWVVCGYVGWSRMIRLTELVWLQNKRHRTKN
jgi:hypothetical protein